MNTDRPLQQSILLSGGSSRRQAFECNAQQNAMKNSSTFDRTGQTQPKPYFVSPSRMNNMGNSPRPFRREATDNRVEMAVRQLNEKMDRIMKVVDQHDCQLRSQANSLPKADELTKSILSQVRQSLPSFSSNDDVYEHIFNLKLDIKDMQQKLAKYVKENQFKTVETVAQESIREKSKNPTDPKPTQMNGELKKRDEYFSKIINGIQTEISILKKSLQAGSLELKVSSMTSKNLIMLKYQQLFKVKASHESEALISEYIYYVDTEGHLLDGSSRYLVDQKGKKVKLEEKHLHLLRNQKILL